MRDAGSMRDTTVSASYGVARASRKLAERRVGHRPMRRSSTALALSRLEREHVALLLAICELESPNDTDSSSLALRDALLPLLREDLRQTQRALTRAANGNYGACEDCGRALSARLLELDPSATTCPVCQSHARRATVD
ncbi:MAG TPA: hypothetical protein VKQ30_07805 [Ktedonobacterales bacterium]|nr:hypothetical protein [Ktedonobacterales bacterium]